jgi:hypothetical protein
MSGMPVRATINGDVWEFDTPAEAAEFRRQMTAPAPVQSEPVARPRKRGRPKRSASALRSASRSVAATPIASAGGDTSKLSSASRRTLTAIQRAPNGLQTEDLAEAVGAAGPSGIPIRMMVLRKELKGMGVEASGVIHVDKIYVKGRKRTVYKPGPHMNDVLHLNGELFGAK